MRPYDAELTPPPAGIEPYEPTPQDLSPLPYDHVLAALATHHSNSATNRMSPATQHALLAKYAEIPALDRQIQALQIEIDANSADSNSDPAQLKSAQKRLQQERAACQHAGHTLVETNAHFAGKIARGSLNSSIGHGSHYAELEDRIQNGVIGLISGLNNYDPERGTRSKEGEPIKLIDYAYLQIANSVTRFIDHPEIREVLGPHTPQYIQREVDRLQNEHGIADLATIANEGGYNAEGRQTILELHRIHTAAHHVSLDSMTFPHAAPEETWDSNDELPVLLPAEVIPAPSDFMESIDRGIKVDLVRRALDILESERPGHRDAEVLRLRYGIGENGIPQTSKQIGQQLGVSPERIRQIERRAKNLLKVIIAENSDEPLAGLGGEPGNTAELSSLAVKTGRMPANRHRPASGSKLYTFTIAESWQRAFYA